MTKVDDIDYNILSQIFEKIKGMDVIQNAMFSKVNELVEFNKVEKKKIKKHTRKILMKFSRKKQLVAHLEVLKRDSNNTSNLYQQEK
jgi:monoamine oxidase